MPVTDTYARLQTYLSGSGWVILDDNNQPVLRTFSDDTGDEVAAVVRQYNDLRVEVERLQAELVTARVVTRRLDDGWEHYWTEGHSGEVTGHCWQWWDRDDEKPDEPMSEAERDWLAAITEGVQRCP